MMADIPLFPDLSPMEIVQRSTGLAAVILACTAGGRKDYGMRESIEHSRFRGLPIGTAEPRRVPEALYNSQYTWKTELVAAAKVLQLAADFPQRRNQIFEGQGLAHTTFNGIPFIVANDLMLDIRVGIGDNWVVFNKPDPTSSKKNLKDQLMTMLSPVHDLGFREGRYRQGVAAYDPRPHRMRGIAGKQEKFFTFQPFSEADIDSYIQRYTRNDLVNTNGSCRWGDDVLFQDHLRSADGILRGQPDFSDALSGLDSFTSGSLRDIESLLIQAREFDNTFTTGPLTGDIRRMSDDFLHIDRIGEWGEWISSKNDAIM